MMLKHIRGYGYHSGSRLYDTQHLGDVDIRAAARGFRMIRGVR